MPKYPAVGRAFLICVTYIKTRASHRCSGVAKLKNATDTREGRLRLRFGDPFFVWQMQSKSDAMTKKAKLIWKPRFCRSRD